MLPNHSYVMASFDGASLFSNVPLDECIDLCVNQLFVNCDIIELSGCKFDKPTFRKLLCFAFKDNHFVLGGKLCNRINGMAMESPLGPSRAKLFMCA